MRFEVLVVVTVKIPASWEVTSGSSQQPATFIFRVNVTEASGFSETLVTFYCVLSS